MMMVMMECGYRVGGSIVVVGIGDVVEVGESGRESWNNNHLGAVGSHCLLHEH